VAEGRVNPDAGQRAVLPMLEALRQRLEAPPPKKGLLSGLFARAEPEGPMGLYLWGGVGRGKSMLMDLFAEAVAIEDKRRVHFHAFMQEIHAGMHAARKRGVEDALEPVAQGVIAKVRLLAFDEMQITDITDAMIVGRLFEKLFAAGVMVVTTSNRPPEDLYKDGLNRALFLPFIGCCAPDAGGRTGKRDRLPPAPAGGRAGLFPPRRRARARDRHALAGTDRGRSGHAAGAEVQGRKVELPQHHNGVARAGFWELCGRPLGPADYLEIARNLRLLILEHIPRLSAANYNEAKRFVTLIDTLYEARVRLIASAADAPEKLYIEGAGRSSSSARPAACARCRPPTGRLRTARRAGYACRSR
jgi:cell division protein ZapE